MVGMTVLLPLFIVGSDDFRNVGVSQWKKTFVQRIELFVVLENELHEFFAIDQSQIRF
jgi:hypothetical protein